MSVATAPQSPARPGLTVEHLRLALVWLMFASGFFVKYEPAPCDLLFGVSLILFLATGLSLPVTVAPLVLLLVLYNLGGLLSYTIMAGESSGQFVVVSAYMATMAVFLACFVYSDPVRRMRVVVNGYLVGGFLAAVVALIGYFNIAGTAPLLMSTTQRAQGFFKDPNVLSTFLIPPALFIMQGFLLGTVRHRLVNLVNLLAISAVVFLAFSRGAWVNYALSAALLAIATFVLAPEPRLRSRIVVIAIVGAVLLAIIMVVLLSVPSIRDMFSARAELIQSYDAGEKGRFGNQINALPLLLQLPFGFGPLVFDSVFGAAPHNVFVNAFSAYGWLGGCAYAVLVIVSIIAGLRAMLVRTPWQFYTIAVVIPLIATMMQGVQIDTDHWRHFYWLLGLSWGLFAASQNYLKGQRGTAGNSTP